MYYDMLYRYFSVHRHKWANFSREIDAVDTPEAALLYATLPTESDVSSTDKALLQKVLEGEAYNETNEAFHSLLHSPSEYFAATQQQALESYYATRCIYIV